MSGKKQRDTLVSLIRSVYQARGTARVKALFCFVAWPGNAERLSDFPVRKYPALKAELKKELTR